jgi:hypothetical protein
MPRHSDELARSCNYPADRLRQLMRDLADRLPDEASTLQTEIRMKGMRHEVLSNIVDGIDKQCRLRATMA